MKNWKKLVFALLVALTLNLFFVFTPQAQNNNSGQAGTPLTAPRATIKQWHQTR